MDTTEKNLEKLNKLKAILDMMDQNISRAEFVKSFENIVNLVLKTETTLSEKTNKAIANLESLFNEFKNGLENKTNKELSRAITELKDLATKIMKEQQVGMDLVRDKLRAFAEQKLKDDEELKKELFAEIPEIKETILDNPEKLRDKLEILRGKERLSKDAIDGLEDLLKERQGTGMSIFGGNRPLTIQGAGVTKDKVARVINFTGATVSRSTDGVVTVAITAGGTPVSEEVPVNSGDNLNFTIAHTPTSGTFHLFRGGSRISSPGDYTLTGTALVLVIALDATNGETLTTDYSY